MKEQHNKPSSNNMSEEEFRGKLSLFKDLINASQDNFSFTQDGKDYKVQASIKSKEIESFLHKIFIDGKDPIGKFEAQGYFLCD